MSDDARLLVRLEVSQRKLEKQLARVEGQAVRAAERTDRSWQRTNAAMVRGFQRTSQVGTRAMARLGGAVGALAAGLGARQVTRYADAWTAAGNRIRAAESISGRQARTLGELNDQASANRASLSDTVDLYAKLLAVSGNIGASEIEVARATDIVTQAFKAGGAAASEQAAGILQLGQALSSGFLQGDELRSIRENAPLLAQAIADGFGVSIGALKDLGAEGELTADRVFRAILDGQDKIGAAFGTTIPTVSDGFTVLNNGLTEFVAAIDQGSGASAGLTDLLIGMGGALSENEGAAGRFGARMAEVLDIVRENAGDVRAKLAGITGGLSVADLATFLSGYIDMVQALISNAAGAAAAVKVSFLNAVDAVAEGGRGIANAAIGAIEALINGIVTAISRLVSSVNNMVEGIEGSALGEMLGVDLPSLTAPQPVSLRRVLPGERGGGDPGLAFEEARFRSGGALKASRDAVTGLLRRVERAGRSPNEAFDPRGNQLPPVTGAGSGKPTPVVVTDVKPGAVGGGSGGGGGRARSGSGGRGGGAALDGLFASVADQRADLEAQIANIGRGTAALAEQRAKQELLNEARERGLSLDARAAGTNRTLGEEIDAQASAVGRLTEQLEQGEATQRAFDDAIDGIASSMADVLTGGENLRSGLASVFKGIASDLLRSGIRQLLGGLFTGQGGKSGGFLGGIVAAFTGKAPSFAGGGFTGSGSRSGGVDGRGGFPAILHPNETVIDHTRMRGGGTRGGAVEIVVRNEPGTVVEIARQEAASVTREGIEANNGRFGDRVQQHRRRPNRRGV